MDIDTIFAPATIAGRSALAVIRLSGPQIQQIFQKLTDTTKFDPGRTQLCLLKHPITGEKVDQAIIIMFSAPRSFTGEDMAEIHHHGGLAVGQMVMDALNATGCCRLAEPGELTKRAFLNGKVDLTEAEGIADLIDATTSAQARQALNQLQGGLRRQLDEWRDRLKRAVAHLEAEIDFASDEAVEEGLWHGVVDDLSCLKADIARAVDDNRSGERVRNGIVVAIIGPPNVGKSSLINYLAKRDVAIVTDIPGTTRDVIEVHLDLDGLPVQLLDTAGLRETEDPVEAEGVRRARNRAEQADLRLYVAERQSNLPESINSDELVLLNKCDDNGPDLTGIFSISCMTGRGMTEFLSALRLKIQDMIGSQSNAPITRERHRVALESVLEHLSTIESRKSSLPLDLITEEARLALRALGRVSGHVGVEELLDEIFGSFCIGK